MKIARVEVAKFRLPLSRRYRAGAVDTAEREGRFVRVLTEDGAQGYGEIAPLPGLHAETLDDVDHALRVVGAGLQGREFGGFDAFAQNVATRVAAVAPQGCPSVIFGLQMAGAGALAYAADTTPAAILTDAPLDRVAVNALFVGNATTAAEAMASGELDGYSCVKLKVGQQPLAADREVIQILLAGLPNHTTLRLDANRGLELSDALERFKNLPPERIEYLEEPLIEVADLAELSARTGLSIGLDETLHAATSFDMGRAPWVVAWCIKPAQIGHFARMQFLAREAERYGSALVVSSALETGLGLSSLAQIAAALPGRTAAAGIGTEGWLRLDTVTPAYDSSCGFVRTSDWRGALAERILDKLRFIRAG
ncbi:MAG: o-succinylbenzoate synthase [Planctomycetota bacterium]|nr:o-succinylbenzoate synthase [Planctomycetota bacterium]